MKIILTGSTGFIGGEVLQQCLQNPAITSVVALSRKELPASVTANNPKLKVVIMHDFADYPEDVQKEVEGADACIWALGKAAIMSSEEARRMTLDYTLTAVDTFQQNCAHNTGRNFRFVYLSGRIAERDQSKGLWYMQESRRIRGQLESELISFDKEHDNFESYVVRPSMVLTKDTTLTNSLSSLLIATTRVDVLSHTMIDLATKGNSIRTFENADINNFSS